MNKKGQVLVSFVLLIPLLLVFLLFVIDISNMHIAKTKVDGILIFSIQEYLEKSKTIEEIKNDILRNDSNIENINIELRDNKIKIRCTKKFRSIFKNLSLFDNYEINSYYQGNVINGKIIVRKG